MRLKELHQIVQGQPVFETSLLVAGEMSPYRAQRQLTEWSNAGKVLQLRRGVYTLPDNNPHPFVVANHLVAGSYVSLQMALDYYHLIPEHVAVVTSVTTGRPSKWENRFGRFVYRHINPALFFGIEYRLLVNGEYAFVATPEKALLDLIYLKPQGDSAAYIESLRLQHTEILNIGYLYELALRSEKPKLKRAAKMIEQVVIQEAEEYETL